jgi:hypothetical protein
MAITPVAVPFPQDNSRAVSTDPDADILSSAGAFTTGSGPSSTFNVFRYPENIGNDEQPHYVMFFITVRESDISQNEQAQIKGKSIKFDQSQSNRPSASTEAAQAAVAGQVLGSAFDGVQKTGTELLEGNVRAARGAATKAVVRTAGAAVSGAALATVATQRDQVILKDAIAMYLSGKPSSSYKAGWNDQELGVFGGILSTNRITPDLDGLKNILQTGQGAAASYILQNSQGKGDFEKSANATFQSAAGQAPNPFKAQLFKSMNFRTFSFDYIFLPKSESEYKNVQQIIKTFKKYMHPKFGAGKFILNYPAEFNIVYYHKEQTNKELFRMANCALTDLQVEYGGTDFTTFKGTLGAPTEIAMKLTFTELELLTRERIENGGF